MLVEQIVREGTPSGRVRWRALVGGKDLFFEVDAPAGERHSNPADSFAAMALAPAMLRGEPLRVMGEPVSTVLARNLLRVQAIWHSMDPRYRKVPLEVETRDPAGAGEEEALSYSAGVDSLHAFQVHEKSLTSCVMICGFDMEMSGEAIERSVARNRSLMERRGKELRVVVSNQLTWGLAMGLWRPFVYGSYLAGSAYFHAPRRLLLAAARPYAAPAFDGISPHLDPLWSNGVTQVEHTGAEYWRHEKLKEIARDPELLEHLRVCFFDQNHNCGWCGKCLRTMAGLRALGVPGPFPRVVSLREIRAQPMAEEHELHFAIGNLMLAVQRGDTATERALRAAIRRYDRRQAIRAFDRGFLRGALRRVRRSLRGGRSWAGPGFPKARPDLDLR
jgi:hypothetical protein